MLGRWQPGGFPPGITLAVKITILGAGAIRGIDYLVGDSSETSWRLSTVEAAAPLWLWGAVLLSGSILGLISIVTRFGRGVLAAHLIDAVIYASLGVGVAADVIVRTEVGLEIIYVPAALIALAVLASCAARKISTWEYIGGAVLGVGIVLAIIIASLELDGIRSAIALVTSCVIHTLLGIGTASRLRQEKIMATGCDPIRGDPID